MYIGPISFSVIKRYHILHTLAIRSVNKKLSKILFSLRIDISPGIWYYIGDGAFLPLFLFAVRTSTACPYNIYWRFSMGTIINMAAILLGGVCGILFGKAIPERFKNILYHVSGVAVLFIGIGGVMEKMLIVENGSVSTQGTMMMLLSMIFGAIIGEAVNIQGGIERLGEWLKKKSGSQNDGGFIDAFLTASLTVCVGAMAVVGAIEDGISGDFSILLAKAVLDLIIIAVMASAMGKGAVFSFVPVGLLQGSITILARLIAPLLTEAALSNLRYVGSALIFCVGLNLLWDMKIKVANMLPAVIIAMLF